MAPEMKFYKLKLVLHTFVNDNDKGLSAQADSDEMGERGGQDLVTCHYSNTH
jgi:hypothetical protein